jgi:acyl-coenzyme A thioesterase PaaI-like protein
MRSLSVSWEDPAALAAAGSSLAGIDFLRAIGKTMHVGARVATAEGRLVDAAGKLYAHASTTCFVLGLERP